MFLISKFSLPSRVCLLLVLDHLTMQKHYLQRRLPQPQQQQLQQQQQQQCLQQQQVQQIRVNHYPI